jgi:starch synthase (maltosyl-transferring)
MDLALQQLNIAPHETFEVHDLVSGGRYTWNGSRNYIELNPHQLPAHVFKVVRL